MWATWANLLTGLRLASTAPCAYGVWTENWWLAASCFTLAAISDLFDGWLARRYGQASSLGGLLDHATDAIFVTIVLAALSGPVIPWILPVLIPLAFGQYMLDSRTLTGHKLRTSWIGRSNGIAYFVLAGIPIIRNALALDWPNDFSVRLFAWLLVATTLISMIDRARVWIATK